MADKVISNTVVGDIKYHDNGDGTFSEQVYVGGQAAGSGSSANATGTISTQNLNPTTGSATANSAVEIDVAGAGTLAIQVTGTYTGALSLQVRRDGNTWVTVGGVSIINEATGAATANIASGTTGAFQADVSGFERVRITALAAVTGTATVTLGLSASAAVVMLAAPVPAGANTIGTVNLGTGGTGATAIGKAEDAVAASGDTGVFALGVRRDAPTISASASGDYNEVAVSRHGAVYTQVIDSAKRTYATGIKLTPVAGAVLEIFGAASTVVEINRITLTLNGTAAGKVDVIVNKRSAVSTAGTSSTPTKVPYDAADTAAAATVKTFTAAPTLSGLVGLVRQAMLACGANVPSDRLKLESGQYSKGFTLSSATQAITVELAGTMPTGAELAIDIEWTEY